MLLMKTLDLLTDEKTIKNLSDSLNQYAEENKIEYSRLNRISRTITDFLLKQNMYKSYTNEKENVSEVTYEQEDGTDYINDDFDDFEDFDNEDDFEEEEEEDFEDEDEEEDDDNVNDDFEEEDEDEEEDDVSDDFEDEDDEYRVG